MLPNKSTSWLGYQLWNTVCRYHIPILFPFFMTYHRICNHSSTAYAEHLSSPSVYFCGVHVAQSLVFCVVVCSILYVLCAFVLLVIELSALRFTVCDYPFVIFKPFLHIKDNLKHIIANNRMLALVLVKQIFPYLSIDFPCPSVNHNIRQLTHPSVSS